LLLPIIQLALIETAILYGRDKLLRSTGKSGIVCLIVPGERSHGGVMEIVVP
jgi:hypothetical protein